MQRNRMNLTAIGALGALAGLLLIPALNQRTRRRMMRAGRNAYTRASDIYNDIKDMRR